jgi:hypothetical protein
VFNKNAASAICKVFKFVEQIASEFERAGFTVQRNFPKRWWESEHGLYIRCGNEHVLFLGIWMNFWEDHGYPLCISVVQGKWAPAIITRFQQTFPGYIVYPPHDAFPNLTQGIDQHLLMGDAVQDVSHWLLQGYLKDIGTLFPGNQQSTG